MTRDSTRCCRASRHVAGSWCGPNISLVSFSGAPSFVVNSLSVSVALT